ncbi:MAG: hypothetical protein IJ379_01285 [Lachnospiraceae bacterium]|nr:hypothetical protein [Lachnospiraceae bacterium]
MTDVMLAETPVEKREQVLRDSCDQIVERSYTRKFDQPEINERRSELANVSIQLQELEDELAQARADIKGKIKPLLERRGKILDELKAGGEWVKGDVYKFVDVDEGRTAFYSPEGYKLEERPITPEERQRNVFQFSRTGTDN